MAHRSRKDRGSSSFAFRRFSASAVTFCQSACAPLLPCHSASWAASCSLLGSAAAAAAAA
eukprot:CAMPEP_0168482236 /NCGR_PEP_ID=MMETSP0228-20121227/64929_1 /TAXON_ID=133427 /ORGANISM="Protoceratium reticulatum, Strain CCCM 535 (=CCMP 1889)" /LENGTH=59 /DNA_ID=CAMNT_0008498641 /DNA_START=45 /DNA_END=221 /DNA_ORIENTATION=-